MRVLIAACALAASFSAAHAKPADCELTVEGKTWIRGACDFDAEHDGSFVIRSSNGHFAYANRDGDRMRGSWNGPDQESRAHYELGMLSRDGACWVNAGARICAWAAGTGPAAKPVAVRGAGIPEGTYQGPGDGYDLTMTVSSGAARIVSVATRQCSGDMFGPVSQVSEGVWNVSASEYGRCVVQVRTAGGGYELAPDPSTDCQAYAGAACGFYGTVSR